VGLLFASPNVKEREDKLKAACYDSTSRWKRRWGIPYFNSGANRSAEEQSQSSLQKKRPKKTASSAKTRIRKMKWRVRNPPSVYIKGKAKINQQFSTLSEIKAHQQLQDADQEGGGDSTEETCVRIPGAAVVNLEAAALGSISIFKMFCYKRKRWWTRWFRFQRSFCSAVRGYHGGEFLNFRRWWRYSQSVR